MKECEGVWHWLVNRSKGVTEREGAGNRALEFSCYQHFSTNKSKQQVVVASTLLGYLTLRQSHGIMQTGCVAKCGEVKRKIEMNKHISPFIFRLWKDVLL